MRSDLTRKERRKGGREGTREREERKRGKDETVEGLKQRKVPSEHCNYGIKLTLS